MNPTMIEVTRADIDGRKEAAPGHVLVDPEDGAALGASTAKPMHVLVAGGSAVGAAPTSSPVLVSGVDSGGLTRRVLLGPDGAVVNFGAQGSGAQVIANGVTEAAEGIDLGSNRAQRLIIPGAFDGSVVYVRTSVDGVAYNDLYDEYGTRVALTVAPGRSVALTNRAIWDGVRYLRLVAATPQTADRTVTVVHQP